MLALGLDDLQRQNPLKMQVGGVSELDQVQSVGSIGSDLGFRHIWRLILVIGS